MKSRYNQIFFLRQAFFLSVVLFAGFAAPLSGFSAAVPEDPPASAKISNVLSSIWGGGQTGNASIVFYLETPAEFNRPKRSDREIRFRLKDTATNLPRFRRFLAFDTWVTLENRGSDILVRVGISENTWKYNVFSAENPYRIIVNLYNKEILQALQPQPKSNLNTGTESPVDNASTKNSKVKNVAKRDETPTVKKEMPITVTPDQPAAPASIPGNKGSTAIFASPGAPVTTPDLALPKKNETKQKTPEKLPENMIQRWIDAWQSGDMNTYAEFYAEDFSSSGMNKRQWIVYKEKISLQNRNIEIRIGPTQFTNRNEKNFQVSFVQRYASSSHRDVGIKTLRFRKENGAWKIFDESWVEAPSAENATTLQRIYLQDLKFK